MTYRASRAARFGRWSIILAMLAGATPLSAGIPRVDTNAGSSRVGPLHPCSIAGVGPHKDGLEVYFSTSTTLNVSRNGGTPTKVTAMSRELILDEELKHVGTERTKSPFFILQDGDVIQYTEENGNSCEASIAFENEARGLLVEVGAKANSKREFIKPMAKSSSLDTPYKSMMTELLDEFREEEGRVSYDRNDLSETLFYMQPPVVADPVILSQVNRVNEEVRDALYLKAKSEKEKGQPKQRAIFYGWQLAGMNEQLASLTASGIFASSAGPESLSSMALVVNRKTSQFVTVGRDIFSDQMQNSREIFCTMLDVDRAAKMVDEDPKAGSKGNEIFDAAGLYLGKWGCPAFSETVISFRGQAGAPFDLVKIIVAPGVAAPVHQGYLEVDMPVTAGMLQQIKPEYRSAFQAKKKL